MTGNRATGLAVRVNGQWQSATPEQVAAYYRWRLCQAKTARQIAYWRGRLAQIHDLSLSTKGNAS